MNKNLLRLLDQTMPPHLELHVIGDNYATDKALSLCPKWT